MEDIWKITQDLNIYSCWYIYRETNRTTDCLSKKGISVKDYIIWKTKFPRNVIKYAVKDFYGTSFNRMCSIHSL